MKRLTASLMVSTQGGIHGAVEGSMWIFIRHLVRGISKEAGIDGAIVHQMGVQMYIPVRNSVVDIRRGINGSSESDPWTPLSPELEDYWRDEAYS
jgi:hypothetical protein